MTEFSTFVAAMRKVGLSALLSIGLLFVAFPVSAATPASYVMKTGLPVRALTPGATNPAVTQANIQSTICKSGWTTTVRPPTSWTNPVKTQQIASFGFTDHRLSSYEEDHLIPLELGGSPTSLKNLWPEPHHIKVGGYDVGSYAKDGLETHLKSLVCKGKMSLSTAQKQAAGNWVVYWKAWKGYKP
jgi:hypothetical protein